MTGPARRVGFACGRDPSVDSTAIVALEREWLSARDTATLSPILAPDFRHDPAPGVVLDRSAHMGWVAAHPRPRSASASFEKLEVRTAGAAAVATGVVASRLAPGQPVKRSAFTDGFACRDGRWVAIAARERVIGPAPGR